VTLRHAVAALILIAALGVVADACINIVAPPAQPLRVVASVRG
jgi:hypothetical protein